MSVLYIKYVRDGKTAQQGMAFTDQSNGLDPWDPHGGRRNQVLK